MIESAIGLILRTRPLTETSLIVNWLTPDFGRISTVAKGARRKKSPFLGKLDLFFLADFTFQRSRRSDLHTLREVSLRETHSALRQELNYLRQASYCAALIQQTTETETPLPTIFNLLASFVKNLSSQPPQPQNIFSFELKLLKELGLSPSLASSKLNKGTKRLLAELTERDWAALRSLKLSATQSQEIHRFLHGFLIYHLDKIPSGRSRAISGSN